MPDAGEGERRDGVNRWTAIVEQVKAAQAILAARQPRTVLTAGGDCACDVAVIDYLNARHPGLTVVWIDAHLDANTPEPTPSGSFHGMPVASLMGAAPMGLKPLLGAPLSPSQLRYVAADVGDDGEWAFQRKHNMTWLTKDALPSGPVHIHFDLDVLDPEAFPYLAYTEGRMPLNEGLAWVRDIAGAGKLVGLTITEFAPRDEAGARAGADFIARLCAAAVERR